MKKSLLSSSRYAESWDSDMKKFFTRVYEIIKNNFWQKMLALLFAFIIWSYILVESNPTRRCEVNNLSLNVIGSAELESKHLMITDGLDDLIDIDVVIEAEQSEHKYINNSNVTATIDLTTVKSVGENTVNVNIDTKYGLVKSVSPSTITLTAEEIVDKEVPVTYEYKGSAPDGYYVAPPAFSSNTVRIIGAQSVVDRITEARCDISIVGLKESITKSYSASFLNYSGNKIDYGNLIIGGAPSVAASIKVMRCKRVPIDDNISGAVFINLPDNHVVTGLKIDPYDILIAGSEELLDTIDVLSLEEINVKNAEGVIRTNALVKELDGVVFVEPRTVQITVNTEERKITKTFRDVKINLRSANEDCSIDPHYTDVVITGPYSVLNRMMNSDIYLLADVAGYSSGTYSINIQVQNIEGIDPSNIKLDKTSVEVVIP